MPIESALQDGFQGSLPVVWSLRYSASSSAHTLKSIEPGESLGAAGNVLAMLLG